jgi:succinoglycan biosynthesis protein ExoW
LPPDVLIEIVVVDDASPASADAEIEAAEKRAALSVKLIQKPNGGPASARNTGLDWATSRVDIISFLDSDDEWLPWHVRGMIEGLKEAGFYFTDNYAEGDITWFSTIEYFKSGAQGAQGARQCGAFEGAPLLCLSSDQIIGPLSLECLPHTSSVAYRVADVRNARFEESLRFAGEDHLFWLRLASRANGVCISLKPSARRGRGIDLYRAALNWDHPQSLRRMIYRLALHKIIYQEYREIGDAARLRAMVLAFERGVAFLFARNLPRHFALCLRDYGEFFARDPLGALIVLCKIPYTFFLRALGRLDVPAG